MYKSTLLIVLAIISANAAFGLSGSGSEADPWRIESLADFNEFAADANYWDDHTRLETDVNLAGLTYTMAVIAPHDNPYSYDYDSIAFTGVFEGNGHKITGMTIDGLGAGNDYLALFGCNRGEVRNVGVEVGAVGGPAYIRYVGGLVAWNSAEGSISNCYSTVDVNGVEAVGGLCGKNGGAITGCFAAGSVFGSVWNYASEIGGLVGSNEGIISDCYSTGDVSALYPYSTDVGGLVGHNSAGTIRNCYSTGSVSGDIQVGGLCGRHSVAGAIINSLWNKDTAGCLYSAGGWAVSTAEMKTESTYVGWNDGAWVINEGIEYPHLLWQETPGSIIDYEYPRTYPGNGLDQPFEVDSSEDMVCMSQRPADWDKNFVVTDDIDMSLVVGYRPPSFFIGSFDGQGYILENLTIIAVIIGNNYHLGAFGKIGPGGSVFDLGVKNVNILGGPYCRYVGGLCGENDEGTITGCYTTGSVTGGQNSDDLGGLCGDNEQGGIFQSYSRAVVSSGDDSHDLGGLCGKNEGAITNCYATGAVSGEQSDEIGGLCGENDAEGAIDNCHSTGSVAGDFEVGGLAGNSTGSVVDSYSTGDVSGGWEVGGLVGYNNDAVISNCYSTGDVNGDASVGGLAGRNENKGSISKCYSACDVNGTNEIGGLVGHNNEGAISDCYSTGSASGNHEIGGLVGYNSAATIRNCYSTASVSGNTQVGGLCGRHGITGAIIDSFWNKDTSGCLYSAGGWSMTTVEMMTESTYVGWNNGAWVIQEGIGYPHLLWEGTAGNIIDYEYPRTYQGDGLNQAFELASPEDMVSMSLRSVDWDKRFVLTGDIDMSSVVDYRQPTLFAGSLDGQGHVLANLTVNASITGNNYHLGALGKIAEGAQVADLGVEDVNIIGGDNSRYLGGLCGKNEGIIIACYTTGSVTAGVYSDDLGGLCGDNEGGAIVQSYSAASVLSGDGSHDLGGLCGKNKGLVTKCYATGAVWGGQSLEVGGFCGENNYPGSISKCYSTGSVSGGDDVGGFCGDREGGLMRDCFWDTQTSGLSHSEGGTGRSTELMEDINTYLSAGWDFIGESANGTSETWRMPDGGYPVLGFFDSDVPFPLPGSGTDGDPYLISDANELGMVNWYFADCSFKLTGDIDLAGINWGVPVAPVFGGGFDGDGHKLVNMQVSGDGMLGLFGYLRRSGRVRNLGIEGGSVFGTTYYVGALVGWNAGGSVSNCYSSSDVFANWCAGGLMGWNDDGSVSNCYSAGDVIGYVDVGGLIGWNDGGRISNCYSAGDVGGSFECGGLMGWNAGGSVSNCYSAGDVTGYADVGGLIGWNSGGSVLDCYSTGNASGDHTIGGLIGRNEDGSMSNCYSTGDVSGNGDVGGLVGWNDEEGSLWNCFWDIQMQSQGVTESIGDNDGTFANVAGLPTADMQTRSTFTSAAWDFVGETGNGTEDIWTIHDGVDYPKFIWKLVNLVGWCEVDFSDFAFLANRWMDTNCGDNDDCGGADFDFSGGVNGTDLQILLNHWLDGAAL